MHQQLQNNEPKAKVAKSNAPIFTSVVQKKMTVGAENDAFEAEADTMANRVMQMQDTSLHTFTSTPPAIQKKCTKCEEEENRIRKKSLTTAYTSIQRKCSKCEEEEQKIQKKSLSETITPFVQRSGSGKTTSVAPSHVESSILSSKGTGSPMDTSTKSFMENRFEADFSQVRIHTDSQAVQMSRELNAQAFTVGNDIYFNEGRYNPNTHTGKHLLAHELTHTIQQGGNNSKKVQKKPATIQRNLLDDIGNGISSAASTAWDYTGGAAIRFGGQVIEWVEDQAADIINRIAPGLLPFLRGNIWENIRDMIGRGIDALTGGLFTRLQEEGLDGVLSSFIDGIVLSLQGQVEEACRSFAILADKIFNFLKSIGGAALTRLRAVFNKVSGFFSSLWTNYGKPAIDAIKHYARAAWDWIVDKAKWVWNLIKPIINGLKKAWDWIKKQFNIAWSSATSAWDWLVEKATEAWNWIKEAIEPIKTPLMIIGGIILMLSPVGPFLLIGAAAYGIYRAVVWIKENWDNEVFVKFRETIRETILNPIQSGLQLLKGLVNRAVQWLSSQFERLQAAFGSLVSAVARSTIFRALRAAVARVTSVIRRVGNMVFTKCKEIGTAIAGVVQSIWQVIKPYAIIVAKLIFLALNPWLLPIVIAAWFWRLLPDCFKPPIINFVLKVMIAVLGAMPNFAMFGDTWVQVKTSIIQFLQQILGKSDEEKVIAANRVAKMVSELDLSLLSNQVAAAMGAPAEFEGQMEEELVGSNLTIPLPFEKTDFSEPSLMSQLKASGLEDSISHEDAALFGRSVYTDEDIDVDSVGEFEPSNELQETIFRRTGGDGTIEFGQSEDSSRTVHGILSEMVTTPTDDLENDNGENGSSSSLALSEPLSHEEETELRLQEMMAQSNEQMASLACNPPQESQGEQGPQTEASSYPEEAKFGPLTRNQRFRYTINQMRSGLGFWWRCNKNWLIPTIIGSLIVLVLAEILTGGAITAALPAIFGALAPIMIGVAVIRAGVYLGEYVYKSINGDIPGASKSLARAFAVAAVEAIFALLGSSALWRGIAKGIGATARLAGRGARAVGRGVRAVGRGVRSVYRGTGRAVSSAGRFSMRALRGIAGGSKTLLRTSKAIVQRGKLILQGIKGKIGKGIKTLDDLAERLFARVRFRGFRIIIRNGWYRLEGYINPWELLMSGKVVKIDDLPEGQPLGPQGNRLIIGSRAEGSNLTRYLEQNALKGGRALDENRELYELIMSKGIKGSSKIYDEVVQNFIRYSDQVTELRRMGMSLENIEKIVQNVLQYRNAADLKSTITYLKRIQRFNIDTYSRLVSELTHPFQNKFAGGEFLLKFLGGQSNEFIAGIKGFEIVKTGRRVDMALINGLEYEFKNWGNFSNVAGLAKQMQNDFRAGAGLMNSRYVISNRAGSTADLISNISAQITKTFSNPAEAQLAIQQLNSVILRY